MSSQVNIFLLLFGGLQGLLLSFFLIKKQSYRNGYGYLLAYLLVLMAQVLFKVMNKGWLMNNMQLFYLLSSKLPLLYGPLVFLFIRNVLRQPQSQVVKEILHFVPFIFAMIMTFWMEPYYWPEGIGFLLHGASGTALQALSLVVYHYCALELWKKQHDRMRDCFSNDSLLRMQWLRQFIILSLALCVIIALLIYFMYMYYPAWQFLRWGFIVLTIFVYWISYSALSKPVLFSSVMSDDPKEKQAPILTLPAQLIVHRKAEKYSNTSLKEEEAVRILARLEQVMVEQKPFLDPELSIDKLALLAGTNRHSLSQVLNERTGKSFYDYINQHRVDEAKKLLMTENYTGQKIASIAYDAGFNSLSAFNEVFKKLAGTTPSQFRKNSSSLFRQQRG